MDGINTNPKRLINKAGKKSVKFSANTSSLDSLQEFLRTDVNDLIEAGEKDISYASHVLRNNTTIDEKSDLEKPPTISKPVQMKITKQSLVASNWDAFVGGDKKSTIFKELGKAVELYKNASKESSDEQVAELKTLYNAVKKARVSLDETSSDFNTKALDFVRQSEKLDDFELELSTLLKGGTHSSDELNSSAVKNDNLKDQMGDEVNELLVEFGAEMVDMGEIESEELKQINGFLDVLTMPLSHSTIQELLDLDSSSAIIEKAQAKIETLYKYSFDTSLNRRRMKTEILRGSIGTDVHTLLDEVKSKMVDMGKIKPKELIQINSFLNKASKPLTHSNIYELLTSKSSSKLVAWAQGQLEHIYLDPKTKVREAKVGPFPKVVDPFNFSFNPETQFVGRAIASGGSGQILPFADNSSISNKTLDPNGNSMSINLGHLLSNDAGEVTGEISNYQRSDSETKFDFTSGGELLSVSINKDSNILTMTTADGVLGVIEFDDSLNDCFQMDDRACLAKTAFTQAMTPEDISDVVREVSILAEAEGKKSDGLCQNIMGFKGISQDENGTYMIVIQNEGQDLQSCMAETVFNLDDQLDIASQICSGVSDIHNVLNGTHNDLKLQNITARRDPNTGKVIAKVIDLGEFSGFNKGLSYCEGLSVGYASPEQMNRSALTEKSDVFALGNILMNLSIGDENRTVCGSSISVSDYKYLFDSGAYEFSVKNWLESKAGTATKYDVMCSQMVKINPKERLPLNFVKDLLANNKAMLTEPVNTTDDIAAFIKFLNDNKEAYEFNNQLKTLSR